MSIVPALTAVPPQVTDELPVVTGRSSHQLSGCPSSVKVTVPPSTPGEIVAVTLSAFPTVTGLGVARSVSTVATVATVDVGSEVAELAPAPFTAVTCTSSCEPTSSAATVWLPEVAPASGVHVLFWQRNHWYA